MEGKDKKEIVYEEFEPFCKWQRKEDQDVLEIHLRDFKKEQLKVQISNYGILKISGERPLDGPKRSKFYKEVQISKNYDAPAITAKFANGLLYITMPKIKHAAPLKSEKWPNEPPKIIPNPNPNPNPKPESKPPTPSDNTSGAAKEQMQTPTGSGSMAHEFQGRRWAASGRKAAKVAVTLAATTAMVAALLAYVFYMHKAVIVGVDN